MTEIAIIVAASENNVIGLNNTLPWHLPADLKHFKALTTGSPVLMGRRTFESLPNGPLPNRVNMVLTSQAVNVQPSNYTIVNTIKQAIEAASHFERLYVIGGSTVYDQFMEIADVLYVTRVHAELKGDAFFPKINPLIWELVQEQKYDADEKNQYAYSFFCYRRKR